MFQFSDPFIRYRAQAQGLDMQRALEATGGSPGVPHDKVWGSQHLNYKSALAEEWREPGNGALQLGNLDIDLEQQEAVGAKWGLKMVTMGPGR